MSVGVRQQPRHPPRGANGERGRPSRGKEKKDPKDPKEGKETSTKQKEDKVRMCHLLEQWFSNVFCHSPLWRKKNVHSPHPNKIVFYGGS